MEESQKEKASFEVQHEKENVDKASVKLGLATMKNLTKLAAKARRKRVEKKKDNVVKNIHFRGASWLDDSSSTFCIGCDAQFTCYNRRHHCRFCGNLLCNDCSKWRIEGVRACKPCYTELKESLKPQSLSQCLKKPIHPESKFRSIWDVIILLLTFHSAIVIPLEMGFPEYAGENGGTLVLVTYVIDALFVIDVILNFNTMVILSNGDLIRDKGTIAKRYLQKWFWFDLMAIFPAELLLGGEDGNQLQVWRRFAKLPRLLRIARIVKFIENSNFLQSYVRLTRILRLTFLVLISVHWTGCLFYFVCVLRKSGFGGGSKVVNGTIIPIVTYCSFEDDKPLIERYSGAYFTGLNFMLGTMPEIDELSPAERNMAILLGFFNAILNAYIIGQVTILIQGTNTLEFEYKTKIDIVRDTLVTFNLSDELKAQILRYYEYLWSRHRKLDTRHNFTDDLPESLQVRVKMELHRDAIERCSLFKQCDSDLMIALVSALKVRIFLAGGVIIRQSVFGNGMYFLVKGEVVLQTKEKGTFATLGDGAYFGELSLLFNSPTTCTIVALSDCDCKFLERSDFDDIVTTFPQFNVLLRREARRKYEQYGPKEMRINLSASAVTSDLRDYGTRREIETEARSLLKLIENNIDEQARRNENAKTKKYREKTGVLDANRDEFVIKRLTQLELRQQKMFKVVRDIANHFHLLKGSIKKE